MGPIIEEFKQKREQMISQLHAQYSKGLAGLDRPSRPTPFEMRVTVQGGSARLMKTGS